MSNQPAEQKKLTKTQEVLLEMLRENTGRALCDSGDFYGRNYDRNQRRDLVNGPCATMEIEAAGPDRCCVMVNVSLFHWLSEILEYDEDLTKEFQEFSKHPDREDSYDLENMEAFAAFRGEDPATTNTCNHDNVLDQTIQFVRYTDPEDKYSDIVLLQVHGGCDLRGGYTDPKVFRAEQYRIWDYDKASIWCDSCRKYWQTDDGAHWYEDGGCGKGLRELESYPLLTEDVEDPELQEVFSKIAEISEAVERKDEDVEKMSKKFPNQEGTWKKQAEQGEADLLKQADEVQAGVTGVIVALPGGRYSCPCCGKGRLQPSF